MGQPAVRILSIVIAAAFAVTLAAPLSAEAPAEPPQRPVTLVRISLPITGNDDSVIEARLQRAAERLVSEAAGSVERPLLVLEFEAAEASAATEFERALRLARFLVGESMTRVKTLAYLPGSLEGHAVLVALACEEIAMAPDAQIGGAPSTLDAQAPVEAGVRASYAQIAEARRTAPVATILAMVDPAAELVRVESDRGVDYVLSNELEALREEAVIVSEDILSPAGTPATFTGREARREGIARYLATDRNDLAAALGIAPQLLSDDANRPEAWRPVMVDLDGPLTDAGVRRLETLLGDELERNSVNWIGVRIDSLSGEIGPAVRLAQTLAELGGPEVRTVAYVPSQVEGPAALVALSCDHLIMHEGANLLGMTAMLNQQPEGQEVIRVGVDEPQEDKPGRRLDGGEGAVAEDAELVAARATIRDALAPAAEQNWSLLTAAIDPQVELSQFSNQKTAQQRIASKAEIGELADSDDWRPQGVVKNAGEPLELSAERAAELGVCWQVVRQFDDLSALYGFEQLPSTAKPNWALEFVEALASPGFATILLLIGIVGLYIELNTPGLGVGGFVATLALLLFFWSKFLNGTADWLEVLLFVTGLVFVLLELFVLPGFGVFGLGGALMMVAALILASQTFILPKTETQLVEVRNSLATVAGAGFVFLVLATVLRHYLPHSPLLRGVLFEELEEADRIEQDRRERLADYEYLIGKQGVATTPLLPAGRAEIDGEPVDVLSRGEPIERGDAIEVVEVHASRVIVRRVTR